MTLRLNSDEEIDVKKREDVLHPAQRGLIFKLMFEKSDPTEWAEWLRAPLEQACEAGDSELVDTLLEAGADGATRGLGHRGRTLLHAAATGGNENVIWSLLDHGAKPNIEARLSEEEWLTPDTPLQVAVKNGHAAAAKVLVAAGANMAGTLVMAVDNGHDRLAHDLLLAGADPDEPGFVGWVLTRACKWGHERLVRALLLHEADVSAPCMGHTPLHEAARGGHANIAKILLAAGLDVNAFTWQGDTPLHVAAGSGSAVTVGVLIAAGADVGARHPSLGLGKSPLHVAAEKGHTEAALALLQERGAEVNAVDNSNQQPLHLACRLMRTEMVDLLLKRGADETAVDGDGRAPIDLLPTVGSIMQEATMHTADRTQEDRDRRDAYKRQQFYIRDRVIRLLTRAPNDRAWRRRGIAVLCRARAETLRLRAAAEGGAMPSGRVVRATGWRKLARRRDGGAGRVNARAARGGAGVGGDGVDTQGLGAWLVDLQEDGVFRNIVGFL